MFGRLKSDADRLAADAALLQRERNLHARRGYALFKRGLASPPGLFACFGAGVFAGTRSRRPDHKGNGPRFDDGRQGSERGLARRLLQGPAGAAALRLGTAWLAGALMKSSAQEGAGHDPLL